MYVTSRNKMGAGVTVTPTLSGRLKQTVTFPTDDLNKIETNLNLSKAFVTQLGKAEIEKDGYVCWKDIEAQRIMMFLNDYNFGNSIEMNSSVILSFITRMNQNGELRLWDVFLPAGSTNEFKWNEELRTKTVIRSPITGTSIGVLSSEADIKKWKQLLGRVYEDPDRGCLMLYVIDGNSKSETEKKFYRDNINTHIVGLVLVFPVSRSINQAQYISQDFQ